MTVYNATLYGRTELDDWLKPCTFIYMTDLWDSREDRSAFPRTSRMMEAAAKASEVDGPVCIDVEGHGWTWQENRFAMTRLANWIASLSKRDVGYWQNPGASVLLQNLGGDPANKWLAEWNRELDNARTRGIHPCKLAWVENYAGKPWRRYPDVEGYRRWWKINHEALHRALDPWGVKIIWTLWPQWETGGELPETLWRAMLESAINENEDIAIWGGYRQQYDPDAMWVRVLAEYHPKSG